MVTNYTFRCDKCGYEVMTSSGHDYGMLAVVDTYICKSCENFVDVCVGEYGQTYTKEEIIQRKDKSANEVKFYICPDCGSVEQLVKWSRWKRPCPKCDVKMEKDLSGESVICWD
jgi:ribosomal protein L37AE/L43A